MSQINLTSPGQLEGAGSTQALLIERFLGEVDGTLERKSFFKGWVDSKSMVGTYKFTKKRIGEATVAGVQPGSTPQAEKLTFSNKSILSLEIDNLIFGCHPRLGFLFSSL